MLLGLLPRKGWGREGLLAWPCAARFSRQVPKGLDDGGGGGAEA